MSLVLHYMPFSDGKQEFLPCEVRLFWGRKKGYSVWNIPSDLLKKLQAVYQSCQRRFLSCYCIFVVDAFDVCSVDCRYCVFQSNSCCFLIACIYSNDYFLHSCFHLRFNHFVSQCFFVNHFDSFLSRFDISQCYFLLITLMLTTLRACSLRHGLGLFSHSLEYPMVNLTDIFYLMERNKSMNTFQNYEKNNEKP